MSELKSLRELSEKATPGPWSHDASDKGCEMIRGADGQATFGSEQYYPWTTESDFPFIVACVNYVRERLAEEPR